MIRSLAERFSRNRVLRRRLPRDLDGGPIYVTPDSALRYWHWNLERVDPDLLRIARQFITPESVAWDVGANVGLFAFACAAKARSVLAVEADPWLVSLLTRSAHERKNVDVLSAAVGSSVGTLHLNIAQRGRAGNFIGGFGTEQTGGVRLRQTVVSVTLDWLAERFPAPTVLKIDVEGMEREVLAGGENLLRQVRPAIVCEVLPKNAVWVANFLKPLGYRLHDKDMNAVDFASVGMIAIPSQSLSRSA